MPAKEILRATASPGVKPVTLLTRLILIVAALLAIIAGIQLQSVNVLQNDVLLGNDLPEGGANLPTMRLMIAPARTRHWIVMLTGAPLIHAAAT
jgi:hypothetical protein